MVEKILKFTAIHSHSAVQEHVGLPKVPLSLVVAVLETFVKLQYDIDSSIYTLFYPILALVI